MDVSEFISRWQQSGGAELANSQPFLKELCELFDVPQPEPTHRDESHNTYVFEKRVDFNNGDGTTSPGRVDLYYRGHFVLESKQGVERKAAEQAEVLATKTKQKKFRTGTAARDTPGWKQAMTAAAAQARRYAQALPDEWPPFLIVADVGYCFDLYADFAQSGKNYQPFPDPQSYRIRLDQLADEAVRDRLRAIWLDPHALDASRHAAKITREVAQRLAKLAKSLEGKHEPDTVAHFLMRCLFTMFAEDVGIGRLQHGDFTTFLEERRGNLDTFVPMLEQLWKEMDGGGFSVVLRRQISQFNGGLFEEHTALPINEDQLELLIEAAEAKWNDVEPAIFGTLLERALDPIERHKLGAHYTPRAYVERLVMPTIIEPLREQWDAVYASAVALYEEGKPAQAIKTVREFHDQLCETRVLDPACGSGNFLYVALELMKRLEGEVLNALRDFGEEQQQLTHAGTISPEQFLGIEENPRAAPIADLVLWIGYLQWHFRTRGSDDLPEPIIKKFKNIECRDAVLDWDDVVPVVDEQGNPVTRWDGRTMKRHPVTGEEVPDESAQVKEVRYVNPRKAAWPTADYVVGNPPFIGNKRMRYALGDGYVDAIRKAWPEAGAAADFVMYWWFKGAALATSSSISKFGFITTNSISQKLNRRIVTSAIDDGLSLSFAIPDHPWVDTATCADVRIAMTVGTAEDIDGTLLLLTAEDSSVPENPQLEFDVRKGKINAMLSIGIEVSSFHKLSSNRDLAFRGVIVGGSGFLVKESELDEFSDIEREQLFTFYSGRDLTKSNRALKVIDLFPLQDEDTIRIRFSAFYQRLYDSVRPFREGQTNKWRKKNWWLFSDPARKLRNALANLNQFIVTPRTSEHRFFRFVPSSTRIESEVIAIASDDAFILGVCSSRVHCAFATYLPGAMGVGNQDRYIHSERFPAFPFPDPDEATKDRIRQLGEQLDAHRKRQQELHPKLTMTGMYNVLEKLRAGEVLTDKDRSIHEQGLVSVLKQIHDDLDAAVFDAYGWPHDLEDEAILQRLVDLNHQRAAEEAAGKIRWLRPEFQNPQGSKATQTQFEDAGTAEVGSGTRKKPAAVKPKKLPWPETLPARISAVRAALADRGEPAAAADIAQGFTRARKAHVEELLETLVAVGQARLTDDGRFVA